MESLLISIKNKKSLENKTIVIVGGTKGIGKALVFECLKHGANVVFSGRDQKSAEDIINDNKSYIDRLLFVLADLSIITECQNIFDSAMDKFGSIDGYVHYAGITPIASLIDCDESTYDIVMGTNLKSAFFCTKSAIKHMISNGGGSIVLVGSAHTWSGEKDRAAYAISKGGLYTLFQHLTHNYASDQIRCNYITMGWTATEGELELRKKEGIDKKALEEKASTILPMGRLLTAEDHLAAFVYFLSDHSSMVTGSNIRVTAGEYI